MSRYIDEDKAKNGIMSFVNEYGEIFGMFVNDFNILLERCAVDVEEVKHGRWIDVVGAGGMLGTFVGWKCTICGYEITDRYGQYNYCPNCGAKMDEVTE